MQSPIEILEGLLLGIHHPIHSDMEPVILSSSGITVKIFRGEAPEEIEVQVVTRSPECFDALCDQVIFACGNILAGVYSRSSPLLEDEEGSLVATFILISYVKYSLSTSDCQSQLL